MLGRWPEPAGLLLHPGVGGGEPRLGELGAVDGGGEMPGDRRPGRAVGGGAVAALRQHRRQAGQRGPRLGEGGLELGECVRAELEAGELQGGGRRGDGSSSSATSRAAVALRSA